jgi:hypothetical protein
MRLRGNAVGWNSHYWRVRFEIDSVYLVEIIFRIERVLAMFETGASFYVK